MINNILSNIDGVGMYGVISICIFFSFFIGMLVWAFTRNKKYLTRMGELPLNAGEEKSTDKIQPDKL